MRIGLALLAIGSGVIWALQARAAGELGDATGDTLFATFYGFAGGTLVIAGAAIPRLLRTRRMPRVRRRIPLWLLTGGIIGGSIVWAQTAVVPVIGMALTTTAIVLGGVLTGTVSDITGFGAAGRLPISPPRLLAVLALVVSVALAAVRFDGVAVTATTVLMTLVAFGVGVGANIQQTVNGRLRTALGEPMLPTLLNFVTGTVLIGVAWLVSPDRADAADLAQAPPWAWIAPPIAAFIVFVTVVLAPRLGALALAATLVAGQLVGSLVMDLVLPVPDRQVGPATVVAVLLALVAAALVAVAPRRPSGLLGTVPPA